MLSKVKEKDFSYLDTVFYYYRVDYNPLKQTTAFTKLDLEEVEMTKNLNSLPDPLKNLIWIIDHEYIKGDNEDSFLPTLRVKKTEESRNSKLPDGLRIWQQRSSSQPVRRPRRASRSTEISQYYTKFLFNAPESVKKELHLQGDPSNRKKPHNFIRSLGFIKSRIKLYMKVKGFKTRSSSQNQEKEPKNLFDKFRLNSSTSLNGALSFMKKKNVDFYDRGKLRKLMAGSVRKKRGRQVGSEEGRLGRSFGGSGERVGRSLNKWSQSLFDEILEMRKVENRRSYWKV